MAAVSTTAKIPLPLNLSDRLHQGKNWKLFRQEWKFYELAAGIHKKAQEVRVASLLNVIGKEGMDMYETSQWENSSDTLKIDKVLEKFEERCVPVRNEIYKRYIFFKREQLSDESLVSYITTLLKLSESCGVGALCESLVRDQLILGVKDDRVREKLLGKRDLNLDNAIKTIKANQVTHSRATEISEEFSANKDINALRQKWKPKRGKRSDRKPPSKVPPKLKECLFCSGTHALERKLCPASGQKCKKCGKEGNPVFFYQHLLVHWPHRNANQLRHSEESTMPHVVKFFSQAAALQPGNWTTTEQIRTQFQYEGHRDHFLTTVVAYVMALHNVLHLWRICVVDSNVTILNAISIKRVYPLSPVQSSIFEDIKVCLQKRRKRQQTSCHVPAEEADWVKYHVIMGKPGTGKSQVVTRTIHHAVQEEHPVLVLKTDL